MSVILDPRATWTLHLASLLLFVPACTEQRLAEVVDAGVLEACSAPDTSPPSWAYIYAKYLGPDGPGHCGNIGCHDTLDENHGGWACDSTAHSCYQGMLTRVVNGQAEPLIDPAHPAESRLIDPAKSPLVWFNPLGNMPFDRPLPNFCATRDIPAWLNPDGGGQEN